MYFIWQKNLVQKTCMQSQKRKRTTTQIKLPNVMPHKLPISFLFPLRCSICGLYFQHYNCYSRIKSLENQKSEIFISEKDFKEDIDAIQTALVNHNIVELGNGTFKINKTIKVNEGTILIGNKNTIIDASEQL